MALNSVLQKEKLFEFYSYVRMVRNVAIDATSAPTRFNGRLEIIKPSSEACENAPTSQAEDSSNVPPSVPMRGSWYGPIATEFTEDSSGIVSLDKTPAFSSLQYADSSYISDDGTLSLRLVGQLEKPPG
ncbi:hypothetical protein CPB84DRAFT_237097 [Gymnopilus junonius]|uniref:Uncharacterized protein n=1 Tax=Gymnopilus junonius TaxID=109634 RepID=A0A9P5THJ1_GYMJU|nr:hypothetical protein CPB84DRAFT_237097 [Gymnopilus junonius]